MTDTTSDGSVTDDKTPVVTDTVESTDNTQETSASERQNETPEATQIDEGKESEVKVEDTVEEKLLAGKYKTPEDLEKAYKELESKYGSTSSNLAELTRTLTEAFVSEASDDASQETYEGYEQPNQSNEKLKQDNAIIKFMLSHGDANGEAMQKVLTEDPLISQINGYDAKLEYAYLRSQNMTQTKVIAEAKKEASKQAEVKVIEKQAAQVESSSRTEQVDEATELRSKATGNYTAKEREAARKSVLKKILAQ